ncbi:MAG: hypothetical protein HWN68_01875 [Desulfobacterales bacterium]|nr:hypothetical protein [Desulfobacterales bacterium]
MRFLILCFLIYACFRIIRAWMHPDRASVRPEEREESALVDDVMVKDPFCETYFPKRDGLKAVINGQTHYFCSTACRDKYLEVGKKSPDDSKA